MPQAPLRSNAAVSAPIAAADIYEIEAAFRTPYKLSHGTMFTTRAVLIKLTDSDGVEGWGEANPDTTFSGETSGDTAQVLRDSLLPVVLESTDPVAGRMDATLDTSVGKHLCAKGAVSM